MALTDVTFGSGVQAVQQVPPGSGKCAACIVLHERYGLVEHTYSLTNRIGQDGYFALGPDLFSRWQGDREKLRRGEDFALLTDTDIAEVISESIDYLKKQDRVDPSRIMVMGVCQSGRYPIVISSMRADIACLVVFYGAAIGAEAFVHPDRGPMKAEIAPHPGDWRPSELSPRPLKDMIEALQAPSLWLFGEEDFLMSVEDVQAMREVLEAARKSYRIKIWPHAPHAWMNEQQPRRYRAELTDQAWAYMLQFAQETLGGHWPPAGRVKWEFDADIAPDYDFMTYVAANRRPPA